MKQFWWHQLFFLAFCLFWMSSVQAQSSIDLIASFGQAYSESIDKGDGLAKRKARASLNPEALSLLATGKRVSSLRVSLFSDVVFDLQGIKSDVRLTETVVNEFSISGDKKGSAVLSVTGGVLYGTVTTGANVVYRLQREAKDVYLIEELDQSKFPECANPSGPGESSNLEKPTNSSAIAPSSDAVTSEDDGTLVKVLVAYTQAAETAAGGGSSIASLIATAESETNAGYSTSGVNFLINVVNTTKVTYNEATGYSEALNAITNTSDGLMDSVHGLRDTYSADLVVLIIDNSDYCGIAWKPITVSSSNASLGFSVVGWNCATGYYSFAHEMGHNMGTGHDTYVDSSTLPYAYGHGFVNTSAQVRSIMAYNNLCADSELYCTRVNHWSATDRLYNGSTIIGDAFATNNVALNNSAYSISNYRSSPPASLPNPPTLVDASDGTYSDRIELNWSVVAEATSYNVYYSSSLESAQTLLGAYTSTSINVTGTAPGVVWYFWVYSVNTNGESATGTYDTGYVQSENQADLAITILDATNGTYASGDNLDVIAKIENIGNAISDSYSIKFYASTDTNITPEDYGDWYWDLDALGVGENHNYLFPWILSQSMPNGQYYIGAIVTVNDDSDGSNNTRYDLTPITVSSVPDAPTLTSATPGDGEATLHFTANGNGGSVITGYTATCGAFSQAGASSPITVSGLTNGVQYSCSVIATNVVGDSVSSNVLFVTPIIFSIGGGVSGLTGSGLVLQNNAGDNLAIFGNGSFTFATELVDGSDYAVTVLIQPSNPSQTCSVTNGSGTLAGADVTNIVVTCHSEIIFNDSFEES